MPNHNIHFISEYEQLNSVVTFTALTLKRECSIAFTKAQDKERVRTYNNRLSSKHGNVYIPTSGSTANPKLVHLTDKNIVANIMSANKHQLYSPGHWVLVIPPSSIGGFMVIARSIYDNMGITSILNNQHTWDINALIAFLETNTYHSLNISLVPTQIKALHNKNALYLLSKCNVVLIGGSNMNPSLVNLLARHSISYIHTYGMTETSGGIVWNGVPLQNVEIKIINNNNICVRGPQVSLRYVTHENSSHSADEWLITNDIGKLTGNKLTVTGRSDDTIITGGVNINLSIIRSLINELTNQTEITEFELISIQDAYWGQSIVCLIKTSTTVCEEKLLYESTHNKPIFKIYEAPKQICNAIKSKITFSFGKEWVPKYIFQVKHFPLLPNSKYDKKELRLLSQKCVDKLRISDRQESK